MSNAAERVKELENMFEKLWNNRKTQDILRANFLTSEQPLYKEVMYYFYLKGISDGTKRVNVLLESLRGKVERKK